MEPLHFATEVLDLYGAIVEEIHPADSAPSKPERVLALLPGPLAARLGWEEEVVLSGQPVAQTDGALEVGYGSANLEQLLDLLRSDCSVVRVHGNMPWPHSRNLASEANRIFRFHTKVRMTYRGTQPSHASYLLVYYALNAASEDTYEGLVASMVNWSTLSPTPELIKHVADARLFSFREKGGETARGHSLADACRAVHAEASRRAARQLGQFVNRLERRSKRDAERLYSYYEALAQEERRRKGRRRASGAARTEERLRAIRNEYERKIRDLDMRYALRIRIRPAAAVQVEMPVLRGTYHLQWRRAERMLPVTWNLLLHRFEPIACDGCGEGVLEMVLDEQLHILCSECAAAASAAGKGTTAGQLARSTLSAP